VPHPDPDDPPRRRANQAVGHGTWATDRPPVCGVAGRSDGRLALRVGRRSGAAEVVHQTVVPLTVTGATVYTDEWSGYKGCDRAGAKDFGGNRTTFGPRGPSVPMTTGWKA
jgi:hypothetical protein